MNKEAKQQLAEMQLLMERMDNHMSGYEVQLRKAMINEGLGIGRVHFNSLDELLNEVDLGRSFVGLAYIQAYPTDKIYPDNAEYVKKLHGEVDKLDPNTRLGQTMNSFFTHPEYSKPSGRAATNGINKGLHSMLSTPVQGVLKITNYVFNWGDAEDYGKFYKKYGDQEAELRKKNNFGKNEDQYNSNDWQLRTDEKGKSVYGGTGLNPIKQRKAGTYQDQLRPDASLYGETDAEEVNGEFVYTPKFTTRPDGSKYQRRMIKMGLLNPKSQWYKYMLIDNNGNIDDIENSLSALISKPEVSKDWVKTILPSMSQDEKNFRTELQAITEKKSRGAKQWFEENILYIVGGGPSRITGQEIKFRYVNPNFDISKIPNINKNQLQAIIDKQLERTYIETNN